MRDRCHPETRILVHRGVKARVIPEGPLVHRLTLGIDRSLDDEVGIRRHLDRLTHRRDKRNRFLPKEPGKHVLVDAVRQRSRGGKRIRRIPAQGHRHRHRLAHFTVFLSMPRPHLVQLPMKRRLPWAQHLHPIHAHVSFLRLWILGNHLRQGQKRTTILRPGFQNRQFPHTPSSILCSLHHLLTRPSTNRNWPSMTQLQPLF